MVGGLVGRTHIQPAHALNVWQRYTYGTYGTHEDGSPYYFGWKYSVQRNTVTGDYLYNTYERNSYTGIWIWKHSDAFWVGDDSGRLARSTYTCVPVPGSPYVWNELELFSMTAWAASVVKSGYFPPAAPYESYLKADVESVQYNCDDSTFTPIYGTARSNRVNLADSGIVYVTMPTSQRKFAFPMTQWVGNWYDY